MMKMMRMRMDRNIFCDILLRAGLVSVVVESTLAGPSRFSDVDLMQDLLGKYAPYNPRHIRPGSRDQVVIVKVYPTIVRVNDIVERDGVLKTRIGLTMSWTDSLLSWNPFHHNNITRLHVPPESHWQPDITVHNTDVEPIKTPDAWTLLTYTGSLTSVTFLDVQTYCQLDMQNFPRDVHTCDITLASWMYSSKYLRMEFWNEDKHSLEVKMWEQPGAKPGTSDNPRWELEDRTGTGSIRQVTYSCCPDDPFDQLTITLTLKRRHTTFTSLFTWHELVFLLLVPCQFALPHIAGTRSIFGILILVGITMALPPLCNYLPAGMDGVPHIGLMYISGLVFSSVAVACSCIIVAIDRRTHGRTAPPRWALKICVFLQRVFRISSVQTAHASTPAAEPMMDNSGDIMANGQGIHEEEVETEFKDSNEINTTILSDLRNSKVKQADDMIFKDWQTLAHVLDRLCLCVSLILYIVYAVIVSIV